MLERKRTAIEELCRRYHVAWLDVFGSAATGMFAPDFIAAVEQSREELYAA